jgi:hypothetical protein
MYKCFTLPSLADLIEEFEIAAVALLRRRSAGSGALG